MTRLADGSRLGWNDAFLIVAITTILAYSLLLQVSQQPAAFLDAIRDAAGTQAARALEVLRELLASLQ